ncbi:MAG: retropepsin-like aspartic protease [Candidatus Helarchaeota archaeon]
MYIIKGWFDPVGTPYLTVNIEIPSLNVKKRRVDFLIDTGADCTILNPKDVKKLEIPLEKIKKYKTKKLKINQLDKEEIKIIKYKGLGFGGHFKIFHLICNDIKISFPTEDNNEENSEKVVMTLKYIDLLPPHKYLKLIRENVLGRDILNKFKIIYSPKERILDLILDI